MTELIETLRRHAAKYPLMQPTDAVKLIYQGEFGGGHLIKDASLSLDRIRREYESVGHTDGELFEDIGFGIVRVNLHAIDVAEYPLEMLNDDFVRTAEIHHGDMERFISKLDELSEHLTETGLRFTKAELDEYLTEYRSQGYPAVSHSEAYRQAYSPAYRIVLKTLVNK